MASRKGKPKPRQQRTGGKAAGLLKEIARRRPVLVEPDPAAVDERRRLLGAALPYQSSAPLFFQTALKVGVVPEPPAVFSQPTTALPTIRPAGSLLGLNDDEESR